MRQDQFPFREFAAYFSYPLLLTGFWFVLDMQERQYAAEVMSKLKRRLNFAKYFFYSKEHIRFMEQKPNQVQVASSHYEFKRYMDKSRWNSFYHQLREILSVPCETILEIGVGTGILGAVLKKLGYAYDSMDIDPKLEPTYVGSILEMPFEKDKYNVIGCFQVLEHLPFENFPAALRELFRVAQHAVIISLPNAKKVWPICIHVPKVGSKKFLISNPFRGPREHVFDGEHYWEIDKKGYSQSKVQTIIMDIAKENGF